MGEGVGQGGEAEQSEKHVEVHDGFRSTGSGFGCEGCLQWLERKGVDMLMRCAWS
jgi:hypothetical protein